MPATVARRISRLTVLQLGIVAGVAVAALLAVRAFGRPYSFVDLRIHDAVAWWASGGELYRYAAPDILLGFTYPPFAALLMLPMASLPAGLAGWVNLVLSLAALTLVLTALLVPVADRHGWPRWFVVALAVPLAGALEPSRETLGYGQLNLVLFGLVMADLVALRWQARRASGSFHSGAWAGAGIGLATAVALTPALFIVYLMVTRQWRAATTALGTAFGVTACTFLLAGHESASYFTGAMWQTERAGTADLTPNQSLAGLLARMYDSAETPVLLWLAFSLVIGVVGLTRAASAHAEGDELVAFTLVGLTANVVSPISRTHDLVFVIPAIILLVDLALRRRGASRGLAARGVGASVAAAHGLAVGLRSPIWFPALTGLRHSLAAVTLYALFLVSPVWRDEHAANSFTLALIALVVLLPWRPGAEPAFSAEPPRLRVVRDS